MYEAKDIGMLIARLRGERGWTQKELASRLHVTDKAVSKWERGAGYPDISMIPQLASVLGVTESELLRGCRSDVAEAEGVNAAVRGTLAYVRSTQAEARKRARNFTLFRGTLVLYFGARVCWRLDVAHNGAMGWSVYVIIAAVYMWIVLAAGCIAKRIPLLVAMGVGSVLAFPAVYGIMRQAGHAAAFWPTGLGATLIVVCILWLISAFVTVDIGKSARNGALMGTLLIAAGVLKDLLYTLLTDASLLQSLQMDTLLLAAFFVVLMLLPLPRERGPLE